MNKSARSTSDGPPITGEPLIDAVLADLEGAEQQPVAEQLSWLRAAHEALAHVLESSREVAQSPLRARLQ